MTQRVNEQKIAMGFMENRFENQMSLKEKWVEEMKKSIAVEAADGRRWCCRTSC